MQSSNPVFRRSEGFNGRGQRRHGYPAYGAPPPAPRPDPVRRRAAG